MDQAFVDKIYNEVGALHLELERDPTVLGPNYINDIMAKCRNYLNRVSSIRLDLSRQRRDLMVRIGGEETLFSVDKDRLLAENDYVKRQPNIRDREALVNTFLRDRVNAISALKSELLDLETVEKAVKMVHEELIRTSGEIKTQRQMLSADRVTGAGYGDESNGSINPPSTIDEGELENLMRNELPLVAPAPQKLTVVSVSKLNETAVEDPDMDLDLQAALASLDSEVPTPEIDESAGIPSTISQTPPKEESSKEESSIGEKGGLVDANDPDLLRFLETGVVVPTVNTKKTKASKVTPQSSSDDSGDFDFSDILSSL